MLWGRCLRFPGIVIAGVLLTLVEGLAQQQYIADAAANSNNHQLEQARDSTSSENGVRIASGADRSVDADAARLTEPPPSAELSRPSPAPLPAALFLPNASELSPLDKAYLDAFSILRQDNACSRFYGGSRVIEVLNELKQQLKTTTIDTRVAVRMDGPTSMVTSFKYGFSYRLFERAELNLRGSFFHGNAFHSEQSVPPVGGFPPNTREARVTILLHELAHLVEASHQTWLLPNDGNNEVLSHQNTQTILAVCGKEIRQLSNSRFADELEAARPAAPGPTVAASLQQ
jgi:hypothetical protein